jgi:hypothetical protein
MMIGRRQSASPSHPACRVLVLLLQTQQRTDGTDRTAKVEEFTANLVVRASRARHRGHDALIGAERTDAIIPLETLR